MSAPPTIRPSRRLAAMPSAYPLLALQERRVAAEARGIKCIDLSIGEPDVPCPDAIRAALVAAAASPDFHRYPHPRGTLALREAIATFYARRYGHRPDPVTQILPLIGSKEGVFYVCLAFTDADAPLRLPAVGYPAYRGAARLLETPVHELGGTWEDRYLAPPLADASSGGVVILPSPSNPTGVTLDAASLAAHVAACRARNVLFVLDAAYAELGGADGPPPLPVPLHGPEGVLELHSFSKTLSLAAWRVGFAVGDPAAIDGLVRAKSQVDAGMPLPQQLALTRALPEIDAHADGVRVTYLERQRRLRGLLEGGRLEVLPADATMFVWLRLPGATGDALWGACLEEGLVLVPGAFFGPGGVGCVRLSLNVGLDALPDVAARLGRAAARLAPAPAPAGATS